MKYLFLILFTFNAWGQVQNFDPEDARLAVEKALTSEGWTLDQGDFFGDGRFVMDHPTSKKQIIVDNNSITFRDINGNLAAYSNSPINLQFGRQMVQTFGVIPTAIAGSLTDWVE